MNAGGFLPHSPDWDVPRPEDWYSPGLEGFAVKLTFVLCFYFLIALLGIPGSSTGQVSDTVLQADVDSTTAENVIQPKDFLSLPLRSLPDLIGIQAGAVEMRPHRRFSTENLFADGARPPRQSISTQELDIRGGRPYETAYYLNGVPINDPISGQATTNISPLAISSLTYGPAGLPTGFGSSNSGVSVVTPSGGEAYSAMIEVVSDNVVGSGFDQNWYTGSLSGPLPVLKRGTFFGLVERRWFGDRNPSALTDESLPGSPKGLPGNWLDGWTYHGKATYPINSDISVTLSADGSYEEWSEYLHEYLFNIEHTPYHQDENMALSARFNHDVNPRLSYSLGTSYFRSKRFRGDGRHRRDLLAYGRPQGNYNAYDYGIFWRGDDPTTQVFTQDRWVYTDYIMDGYDVVWTDSAIHSFVNYGDEGHVWNDYLKHKSTSLMFDGNVTYKPMSGHRVEAGVAYQRQTIRSYQHHDPIFVWIPWTQPDANRYGYDIFGNESDSEGWKNEARHPSQLGAYVQHEIEIDRFVITSAVRLDRFDYDHLKPINADLPLNPDSLGWPGHPPGDERAIRLDRTDLEETPSQTKLSPRLSATCTPDDKTLVRFKFGVYYQNVPLENVYVGGDFFEWQIWGSGYNAFLGTEDPKPEKTVGYELSATREINRDLTLGAVLYYRKSSDITAAKWFHSDPTSHYGFENMLDRLDKGLELNLRTRPDRHLVLDARYALASSEITGIVSWQYAPNEWRYEDTYPVSHDQNNRLVCRADFSLCEKEGLRLGDIYPFENTRLTLLFEAAGGLPYTEHYMTYQGLITMGFYVTEEEYNSSRAKGTSTLDLRLERRITVGDISMTPFLWIKNLLDRQNTTNVWHSTGQPDNTGYLDTQRGREFIEETSTPNDFGLTGEEAYRVLEQYPQNVGNPRLVYFGIRAAF